MKNDFDKQIKNLLDDSTAADAGFELNKKAVWDRIESKKETKVFPFRKWASHAAAVVIGILLCLPFLFRSEKVMVKTVTITNMVPSVQTINDTVFVVQNAKQNINRQHYTLQTSKKTSSPENITGTALQQKQEDNNIIDIKPINSSEQVIAKTEIQRPGIKVLHLVDIENENAAPQIKKGEKYAFFNRINIPVRIDDKSESLSMIVSNQFFNTKK